MSETRPITLTLSVTLAEARRLRDLLEDALAEPPAIPGAPSATCWRCRGSGTIWQGPDITKPTRCPDCRGTGKVSR